MTISTLEYDTLTAAFAVCKTLQVDLQPRLAALQAQYDSAGGVKETLTQADLDSVPAFSNLSKQQVDDGLYALTTVILPALVQTYTSMAHLAARHRSVGAAPVMTTPML